MFETDEILDSNVIELKKQMVEKFEELSQRKISEASPENLIFSSVAYLMALREEEYNDSIKQNHLKFARGERLDLLGDLYGTRGARTLEQSSRATFRFHILSAKNKNIIISKGSLMKYGDLFFKTDDEYTILPGNSYVDGVATCTTSGKDTDGIPVGAINVMVDLYPYFSKVENITVTSGGTNIESDDFYRERIRLIPDSFTVAGSEQAYIFWTKKASPDISDVHVESPSPCQVDVYVLTEKGDPSEELKEKVSKELNEKYIRPLTDKVTVKNPKKVTFSINLDYYIESEKAYTLEEIKKKAKETIEEYSFLQKQKLGLDIVPDDIVYRLKKVGVKRVVIKQPVFTKVNKTQYSSVNTIELNYAGAEDI